MKITDEKDILLDNGKKIKKINLSHLSELESLIISLSPMPCSYDVSRVQDLNFCEFGYTEILKDYIYLYPQNSEFAFKMAFEAHKYNLNNFDIKSLKLIDKYELEKFDLNDKINSICFLPGSNILKNSVEINTLNKIMYLDELCYIKPHPLTNGTELRELKCLFPTRIINPKWGAFSILNKTNRVYCSSASELGIYASLIGKKVIDITSFSQMSSLAFSPFYRFLNYPYKKIDLIKVLSHHYGGIFYYKDKNNKDKLKDYFKMILELKKQNKMYSSKGEL